MKRVIALLLAMAMAMSICACGEDKDESSKDRDTDKQTGNYQDEEEMPKEPTEEELEDINNYLAAVRELNQYVEYGEIRYYDKETETFLEGHAALSHLYNVIKDAEGAEKWVGIVEGYEGEKRQDVLDAFTIVEDVMLSWSYNEYDSSGNLDTTWDNDGLIESGEAVFLYYDEKGGLVRGCDNMSPMATFLTIYKDNWIKNVVREYDEEDKVVRAEYDYRDHLNKSFSSCTATYEYDSNGNLSVIHKDKSDETHEFYLTYDGFNRLIQIDSIEKEGTDTRKYCYEFEYSEDDLLSRESIIFEDGEKYCIDYFYEDGKFYATKLTMYEADGVKFFEGEKFPYETEYDEQDRMTSKKRTEENGSYTISTYEYGDFYCYNPEKAVAE